MTSGEQKVTLDVRAEHRDGFNDDVDGRTGVRSAVAYGVDMRANVGRFDTESGWVGGYAVIGCEEGLVDEGGIRVCAGCRNVEIGLEARSVRKGHRRGTRQGVGCAGAFWRYASDSFLFDDSHSDGSEVFFSFLCERGSEDREDLITSGHDCDGDFRVLELRAEPPCFAIQILAELTGCLDACRTSACDDNGIC